MRSDWSWVPLRLKIDCAYVIPGHAQLCSYINSLIITSLVEPVVFGDGFKCHLSTWKCMLTSPASDLAIAGPAGVMLPSKCHIGINFWWMWSCWHIREGIYYVLGGRRDGWIVSCCKEFFLRNAGSILVCISPWHIFITIIKVMYA